MRKPEEIAGKIVRNTERGQGWTGRMETAIAKAILTAQADVLEAAWVDGADGTTLRERAAELWRQAEEIDAN